MKVETNQSFFKSLKEIDSIKNKYYHVRAWFKYHFNKDFFRVLKAVLKSYPWDCSFLYYIEKAKIAEMITYHEKYKRFVGWENVVRDMKICYKLIDIFTEEKELFKYTGKVKFIPIEGSNDYEMNGDDLKYHCLVKVNTKNIDRFIGNRPKDIKKYWLEHPHELYILKAKALYHKIRCEHDSEWWD